MDGVFCNNCGHRNPAERQFLLVVRRACSVRRPSDTTVTLHPVDAQGEAGDEELSVTLPDRPSGAGLLVVKRGPNAGTRFVLDADVTRAGRHPESDIFLDDITVSRRHAEFRQATAATRPRRGLAERHLREPRAHRGSGALATGDEVQIGKFKLVYLAAADE